MTMGDSFPNVQTTTRDAMVSRACVPLWQRLMDIPSCSVHLTSTAKESNDENELDPVSHLWICLRRTDLLIAIYNSIHADCPLQYPDPVDPAKRPKMVAFKFIDACIKVLKIPPGDCFGLYDLFGDNITGFLKVVRLINYVLDEVHPKVSDPSIPKSSNTEPQTTPSHYDIIVRELVETEKHYVHSLQQLHDFKVLIEQKKLLPVKEIIQIFLNLDEVLSFASTFLAQIAKIYLDPIEEQDWGSLFATHEEAFGVYVPYLAFQKRATAIARREFSKISQIDHAITIDITTLEMFLVRPLPRLVKYPLLLKGLRKQTGGNEKVKANLESGIEALERVILNANDAADREDRNEALEILSATVEDRETLRIETLGEILLFGRFPVARGTFREGLSSTQYKVYLFKHVLLACKEIASKVYRGRFQQGDTIDNDPVENPRLQVKGRIMMKAIVQATPLAESNNYRLQIDFKAEEKVESFAFQFPYENLMLKWYHTIEGQYRRSELSS